MHQIEFICKVAVVLFAVAFGFSVAGGQSNLAVALGVAGGLYPLILTAETHTWSQCRVFLAYHVSAWVVFVVGADPGLVIGISAALCVAAGITARNSKWIANPAPIASARWNEDKPWR